MKVSGDRYYISQARHYFTLPDGGCFVRPDIVMGSLLEEDIMYDTPIVGVDHFLLIRHSSEILKSADFSSVSKIP